jgi:hypothetical protein
VGGERAERRAPEGASAHPARERALGAACEGFYGRGGDRAKRGSEARERSSPLPPQMDTRAAASARRGCWRARPILLPAPFCATSPAAGGVRGVSPRQPEILPASAAAAAAPPYVFSSERHAVFANMQLPHRRSLSQCRGGQGRALPAHLNHTHHRRSPAGRLRCRRRGSCCVRASEGTEGLVLEAGVAQVVGGTHVWPAHPASAGGGGTG